MQDIRPLLTSTDPQFTETPRGVWIGELIGAKPHNSPTVTKIRAVRTFK
jgi:hypothetical protein